MCSFQNRTFTVSRIYLFCQKMGFSLFFFPEEFCLGVHHTLCARYVGVNWLCTKMLPRIDAIPGDKSVPLELIELDDMLDKDTHIKTYRMSRKFVDFDPPWNYLYETGWVRVTTSYVFPIGNVDNHRLGTLFEWSNNKCL